MVRGDWRTTFFPYTTLFRSHVRHVGLQAQERLPAEQEQQGEAQAAEQRPAAGDHQDRKSTRLNSSHVRISYAVFCLKKKIIWYEEIGGLHMRMIVIRGSKVI